MSKKITSKMSRTRRRKKVHITLLSRPSIGQAIELRRELLASLDEASAVTVDGGAVEEIDTAVLQLLVSLWRTGRDRGIGCSFSDASPTLKHRARLIGVAEALNIAASDLLENQA